MSVSSGPAAGSTAGQRPRRAVRRRGALALLIFSLLLLFGVAGWQERTLLLRAAADLWIVSDPPGAADAVAVFGGGLEDRPFAAAAYYHQGMVGKILVSNVRETPTQRLGVQPSHAALNEAALLQLGVPAQDIETFGAGLANSHDEAVALRDWAAHHQVRSVIVPTEIFAARRLRWTLRRVFGRGTTVRVPALDPPDYRADDWWQSEAGVIAFQNEVVKYCYYRLVY